MYKGRNISSLEDYEAFVQQLDSKVIDVRSKADYMENHLEGAIHLDALKSNVEDFFTGMERDTPLLVYCNNGSRSNGVLRLLSLMGFTQLFSIENSLLIWLRENTYTS